MAKVSGRLVDVTASPSVVVSVWVRARGVRVRGGDVVTGEGARVPITDGRVAFDALPGPAVLTLERAGVPAEVIPLVVPDEAQVSLGVCVDASRLARDATADALEELAGRAAGAVEHSEASAGEAEAHAGKAASAAESASSSEAAAARDAKAAAASAQSARSSESGAAYSAGKASSSESRAASSASDAKASAAAASTSASQAKASADRADRIATSTSWSGDRLTVNGKTSPPLTGPKGDPGDASEIIVGDTSKPPTTDGAEGSLAAGRGAVASSPMSMAVGYNARATGDGSYASASGTAASASGTAASASGTAASASGTYASASGPSSVAAMPYSVAYGANVRAETEKSAAVGIGVTADRVGRMVLGINGSEVELKSTELVLGQGPTTVSVPSGELTVGGTEVATQDDIAALRVELTSMGAEVEAVRSRPALWSGSGKPPETIRGARKGDWWLDETSMDLYQITGV